VAAAVAASGRENIEMGLNMVLHLKFKEKPA
jgi:hypothetical protein